MKAIAIIFLICLIACGRESSPEGRMQIKIERLEQKIDSLANQNRSILDSMIVLNKRVNTLKIK